MRQCLGCRTMKPKKELLRVVRSPEGELTLDLRGRANGRGAYICRSAECLKRAAKSRALARALGKAVSDDIIAALRQQMEAENEQNA
ncbi:MAG: YlxR family protein [Oscillospiraceae bacterium]|nr:YlxR family protein [Oscillospiraceae bacterium]